MSEVKSNKISPRKGTTTTIGDSGDSVTISSGTTTTNAGTISTAGITGGTINNTTGTIEGLRGQVNWQTGDIKTSGFTASANEGYFCNTTSAAFTVTLPASPSAGDVIGLKDYADTFDTNNLTINANGNKIQGSTTNFIISVEGTAAILLYVDSTKGWLLVDQSKAADIAAKPLFTVATGGTITTCGDFKIHTFTGPGTFCVSQIGNSSLVPTGGPNTVSYAVVAGGGGGGGHPASNGGGGGAGGFREGRDITPSYTASPLVAPAGLTITASPFPITVGGGGTSCFNSTSGANSVFSTITSAGGGGGSSGYSPAGAKTGGSGGGGVSGACTSGAAGNTPPVSPPQGNAGGNGQGGCGYAGAGGGGAVAAGANGGPNSFGSNGGNGGNGAATSITGSSVTRAGGGGGFSYAGTQGSGGSGGGGDGGKGQNSPAPTDVVAQNGTANTGGGGGGRAIASAPGGGGGGGSGIVIIRYKFQ